MLYIYDIDETLYMGDIVKVAINRLKNYHNITFDKDYDGSMAIDYSFSNFPDRLRTEIKYLYNDCYYSCIGKTLLPGIYTYLYYLNKIKNISIGILTSRPLILKEATNYVLNRDLKNINLDFIEFANPCFEFPGDRSHNKKDILSKWNVDSYFDDNPNYCIEASELNIPNIYLISNSHTGWNHQFIRNGAYKKYNIKLIKNIMEVDINGI